MGGAAPDEITTVAPAPPAVAEDAGVLVTAVTRPKSKLSHAVTGMAATAVIAVPAIETQVTSRGVCRDEESANDRPFWQTGRGGF